MLIYIYIYMCVCVYNVFPSIVVKTSSKIVRHLKKQS